MSISNPNRSIGSPPIDGYIKFDGAEGKLIYTDKITKEKKSYNCEDLSFVILDASCFDIAGYGDKPITSPMYKNASKPVKVYKDGTLYREGLWKEIKEAVENEGGSYNRIVFAYSQELDKVVKMQIDGYRLFNFNKLLENEAEAGGFGFKFTDVEEMQKGRVTYYGVNFKGRKVTDSKLLDIALEKDKKLQNYLTEYFKPKENE